jgi:hypothetical protein
VTAADCDRAEAGWAVLTALVRMGRASTAEWLAELESLLQTELGRKVCPLSDRSSHSVADAGCHTGI